MEVLKGTTAFVVHGSTREPVEDFERAHVWFCDLDAVRQLDFSERSVLSTSELARAERIKNPLHHQRFVARCKFVRYVLGHLVRVVPEALEFREGARGKPELVLPGRAEDDRLAALEFNLSHSENILALAVAFSRDVGVDVEVVNFGVDVLGVAEANFAAEELNWLRALPPRQCVFTFYRLWTRKEAMAKATGQGIAGPPAEKPAGAPLMQLHSFQFKFGQQEIVGALAFEAGAACAMPSLVRRKRTISHGTGQRSARTHEKTRRRFSIGSGVGES